ncbi:hypothetical protein DSO57_1002896 [Entomophthora muscae]|uniref:Uncharacterized protein n=1 Tax=Entomophthora muscae TaxID=34485 RepID=A0ACC2SLK9_9FUNG|nr:hypothetical protein DSO57_1002896 [Entomophthora muscae]
MLFERGVVSKVVCKSFAARREIIVALDPLATKPDGFYRWTAFDGTFRGYFNAVLKLRGVKFAHSLVLSLLRQINPSDMANAYNAVISCAAWISEPAGSIKMATEFMDEMLQLKLTPAPSTCHRLIVGTLNEKTSKDMQCTLNCAMGVFRATLPVVGVLPRETYLTLISHLDASSNGNPINFRYVIEVFNQMLEKKSTPNLLLYNIALKNYARLSSDPGTQAQGTYMDQPEDGVVEEERELHKGSWHLLCMAQIWCHMKANGVAPDTYTLNAFMEFFCNCTKLNPMWVLAAMDARIKLFLEHGAKMNGITLMYLINIHGKLDNLKGINGVLDYATKESVDIDNFALSSAINQNLRLKNPHGAIRWFETLTGPSFGLVPDTAVLSLMVDVYSKLNKVEHMDRYWQMCCQPQLLVSGNATPPTLNLTIYQRIINAYANVIKASSAFAKPPNTKDILWRVQMIFRRLQSEQHMHPDIYSYNVYLKAHISYLLTFRGKADFESSYSMAKQVYKTIMDDTRVCPDHITFSTFLNAIADLLLKTSMNSNNLLKDAEAIIQDMEARKFPLTCT